MHDHVLAVVGADAEPGQRDDGPVVDGSRVTAAGSLLPTRTSRSSNNQRPGPSGPSAAITARPVTSTTTTDVSGNDTTRSA